MTKYWYTAHDTSGRPHMRVWLDGWPGDTFEILSPHDFASLKSGIERVNSLTKALNLGEPIQLQEVPDDE